jgi:hypothetical protein
VLLNEFSDQAHEQLGARAQGYDKSEKFDVAIDAPELPVQERQRVATERLYKLRGALDSATYLRMVDKWKAGGGIVSVHARGGFSGGSAA